MNNDGGQASLTRGTRRRVVLETVRAALEARGILADSVDVHLAVEKLRRRHGWLVAAVEGRPGYRLAEWPYRFRRNRG